MTENESVVRRWLDEVVARGNGAMVKEFVTPGHVFHSGNMMGDLNLDDFISALEQITASLSDVQFVTEDLFGRRP